MIASKTRKVLILFVEGVLFSYSQVFFLQNKSIALILLLVTFFDLIAGISGLAAVIVSNAAAILIGFRRTSVSQGLYGFNSLLVGLGVGVLFQPGLEFFFVLAFAALFTLFLTIWLEGFFGKYGLPFLSWPFLLGIWMVSLATRQFPALELSERGVFILSEMYQYGGMKMVNLYFWVNELNIHESIKIYFKSLAAIFFQNHMLAGILVASGLLICSRIAFLLSVFGFFGAYFYYTLIGANLIEFSYSYIGFNYILSAIAIGGFFIIPSKSSFLWVILLTPLISFVIASASSFFNLLGLPIYSLAFNLVVIMFLYILKFRERRLYNPELVAVQHFSPENNLYSQKNYQSRFDVKTRVNLVLPFMSEWTVTQAHNDEHTHREDWRHAWDFEIFDEDGNKFCNLGSDPTDYYCFGKAVLAPADAVVQEIQDGVPDNQIGEMNLANNWGNTIVLMHGEKLYTKLCHLKIGSIKPVKGAYVKRGEIIAMCGNSGRSAIPHLHFQVQSDPFIGSKTIDYPISNYLVKSGNRTELRTFSKPAKNEKVANIIKNDSIFRAFNFTVGQKISFVVSRNTAETARIEWLVKSDLYNFPYLECKQSGSKAYFFNDGSLFSFTHFEGDKHSLLYYFYLSAYKVVLGYYEKMEVADKFPSNVFRSRFLLSLHDFAAPFYMFLQGEYLLCYLNLEDDLTTSRISMESFSSLNFAGKKLQSTNYTLTVCKGRIQHFGAVGKGLNIVAKEVES